MKKEILIAILVGLGMGLIITFGFYRVRTSITSPPVTDFDQETSQDSAESSPTASMLALHNPEDGTVQTEEQVTVTGTTIPNTYVVMFVNNDDFISTTDESGNFSFRAKLTNGANVIRVHVVDADGYTIVEERLVVVSDVFKLEEEEARERAEQELLEKNGDATNATEPQSSLSQTDDQENEGSESVQGIRSIIQRGLQNDRIKGVIDNLMGKKTAMIGEVSRLTDETITIQGRMGARILALGDSVSIIKNRQEIEVSDIAVENWLTVLGEIRNDEFNPRFIFVSEENLRPKSQFVSVGNITKINNNQLTIELRSTGESRNINLNSSTKYRDLDNDEIRLTNLEEAMSVLVTGHETDNGITGLTIKALVGISE
jgi:hypothetical protein